MGLSSIIGRSILIIIHKQLLNAPLWKWLIASVSGAVETLIVWENLTTLRYELKKPSSEVPVVIFVRPDQEADKTLFIDPEVRSSASLQLLALIRRSFQTSNEMEVLEKMPLIEWLANNYKRFGELLMASCSLQ